MPLSGSPIFAAFERVQALRERTAIIAASEPSSVPRSAATMSITNNDSDHPTMGTEPVQPKRAVQHVLSLAQRAVIVRWMVMKSEQYGNKHIPSRAVAQFPHLFRGTSNANIAKASRLWKDRDNYLYTTDRHGRSTLRGSPATNTRRVLGTRARVYLNARKGRGRKRAPWVRALHRDWVEEFDRLRKLGVKFNYRNLQSLGKHLLENSSSDEYNSLMLDSRTQRQLHTFITARFTQSFADRFGIVSRALTGKYKLSPANIERLEKQVAYHLGFMARGFRSGKLNEDCIENVNETHFFFDVDNGRTLGFSGESEVKYADAVSGGEGMTMVVRLSGGRDAKIQPSFMVFKNANRSYPIRGVPDNVSGVFYRSEPKGWMDKKMVPEWLSEKKVICALSNRNKRILYFDNCSGHNKTREMLAAAQNINTKADTSKQILQTMYNLVTHLL